MASGKNAAEKTSSFRLNPDIPKHTPSPQRQGGRSMENHSIIHAPEGASGQSPAMVSS